LSLLLSFVTNKAKKTALTNSVVKAVLMKNGRKQPANIFASDSIITHIPHFVQQHKVLHFDIKHITLRRSLRAIAPRE